MKNSINTISISSEFPKHAVSSEMPVVIYTSVNSSSYVDGSQKPQQLQKVFCKEHPVL